MSNDLKIIYKNEGKLQYYFDEAVPCDLFRGQSRSELKEGLPIIHPNPGFKRKDGSERPPDVMIVERNGTKFVLGCRCTSGRHRGISTFDRINSGLINFRWYKIPESTIIPAALAITQDSNKQNEVNHFTIAPKDDMPLDLFLIWLNALGKHLVEM